MARQPSLSPCPCPGSVQENRVGKVRGWWGGTFVFGTSAPSTLMYELLWNAAENIGIYAHM